MGHVTVGIVLLLIVSAAQAATCDRPDRDLELRYWSDPSIHEPRHSDVLSAFKRAHPCPATGASAGPCAGWVLDHVIPLACGGADAVFNLQWLPTAMWREKSKWERRIYLSPGQAATAYCGVLR